MNYTYIKILHEVSLLIHEYCNDREITVGMGWTCSSDDEERITHKPTRSRELEEKC